MKFQIESHADYLRRIIKQAEAGKIKDYKVSSMYLFARPNSLVYQFLSILKKHHFTVCHDETYTRRMLAFADGHYVFRFSFWDPHLWAKKLEPAKIAKLTRQKFSDILVDLPQRFWQIKATRNPFKKLLSLHLLQPLATSHLKAAVAEYQNKNLAATVATGDLSSESDQNNIALTLEDRKAADFTRKILDPKYRIGNKSFEIAKIAKNISLVADYGNFGRPCDVPKVHQIAKEMIVDNPHEVVLISQYLPSGRILRALNLAADQLAATVSVPLEPDGDYRITDPGFKFLRRIFEFYKSPKISTPVRPVPSHVKCLVVKHRDGDLSMIFGSDNFDNWAETLYRNTELSVVIKKSSKSDEGYPIIKKMLEELVKEKEITETCKKRLLA